VRRVARRNSGLLDDLIELPWWVSLVVAAIVFVGLRWVLPAYAGSNMFMRPLAAGLRPIAWVFSVPFLLTAAFAALRSSRRRELLDSQNGLQTLRALSWQAFERLVGEAYRRRGYTVEETGGPSPDGGIDLLLYAGGHKTLVQCKRWRSAQVGVSLIRELYGVLVAEKAERAIFVTTGTFTADALAFASGKPLELVDGPALAKLVAGVQSPKPAAVTVADTTTPSCPKCGGEMVKRVARRGANAGNAFWGCRRYPDCRGVRDAA
jgi:restriction system protein